jgi:amino acid permease
MSSDWSDFVSRDELLGGLPARRASTLLFAIESRTAHLVAHSRRAMARYLTERTGEEQERAFLDALAQGRDLPLRPTIQDLERYAPEWAALVPNDAALRAAVARMIGERYRLPRQLVPGIRAALGLEAPEVGAAFERLHRQSQDSMYASELPLGERTRWVRSRAAHWLETLPPFWTAFALTLTETVGAGILALPIAVADIGPIGGLVVILVIGLVNLLTIAAMTEAVARNGNVRYGRAYFGRIVGDYLGRPGIVMVTPALLLLFALTLFAYYVGFSSTLANATDVPPEVWAALMFLTGLVFLRRKSLDATVASALVVGATTIGLVLLLSLLALPHVSSANLRHSTVPFVSGEPFDASLFRLVFGVVLGAYFGHTSAGNCAAVILHRDPSARSFIRGSAAALAATLALYSVWVFCVNGAVSPEALAGERGTALEPLADVAGSSVLILGSAFAVLAMGMASIHMSLGLFNQVREWLPNPPTASRQERQFLFGILPVAIIFLAVEALLLSDRASFTDAYGFVNALCVPVLAGIFPMLMVTAARRKGDCRIGPVWRLVGHPVTVAILTLLFFAALVLHGVVIWESPLLRIAALLTAAVAGAVAAIAWRRGAFRTRRVVELRVDPDPAAPPVVNVVELGRSVPADVRFRKGEYAGLVGNGGFPPTQIDLPPSRARELKIWAHRVTPEGHSKRLRATLTILNGHPVTEFDLGALGGLVVVPNTEGMQQIEIKPNR